MCNKSNILRSGANKLEGYFIISAALLTFHGAMGNGNLKIKLMDSLAGTWYLLSFRCTSHWSLSSLFLFIARIQHGGCWRLVAEFYLHATDWGKISEIRLRITKGNWKISARRTHLLITTRYSFKESVRLVRNMLNDIRSWFIVNT